MVNYRCLTPHLDLDVLGGGTQVFSFVLSPSTKKKYLILAYQIELKQNPRSATAGVII